MHFTPCLACGFRKKSLASLPNKNSPTFQIPKATASHQLRRSCLKLTRAPRNYHAPPRFSLNFSGCLV